MFDNTLILNQKKRRNNNQSQKLKQKMIRTIKMIKIKRTTKNHQQSQMSKERKTKRKYPQKK
jgi:hypothetical protein